MHQDLKKNKYKIFRNFLDKEEIRNTKEIERKKINSLESKNYVEWDDPKLWELICNNKIKQVLNNVFKEDYYYMHDSTVINNELGNELTWHRDNTCRRMGYF